VALRVNAIVFGLAAVAALLLTFLLPPAPAPEAPLGHGLRDAWRRERGTIRPVAWMYVVMGVGFGMTFPYFAVHFLDELATPNAQWGVLLGVGTVLSALGAMAAGRLATRASPLAVTLAPQAAVFVALLAFLFPLPFVVLAGAFLARSLLSNTLAPVVNGEMMTRVAPGRRARVQAWASLAWNAGWSVGSIGGGLLFARLHGAVFPLGAGIALAGAAWGMRRLIR
jgi:predicted MFS family arabinose efflux permease